MILENVFVPNIFGLFNLLLIPILIYTVYKYKKSDLLLVFLLVIATFEGTLQMWLLDDIKYLRLIRDIFIVLVILSLSIQRGKSNKYLLIMNILLVLLILFSAIINNLEVLNVIVFLRRVVLYLVLLFFLIRTGVDYTNINKLILVLFLIQIIATIVKLFTIGTQEHLIGTIAIRGGSLTTLLVLYSFSIFLGYYFISKKKVFLLLIFLSIIWGISGQKRALVIYIPVVMIFVFWIILNDQKLRNQIKYAFSTLNIIVLGFILVFISIKFNPTLLPSESSGGSIDLKYLFNYANDYLTSDNTRYSGRAVGPLLVFSYMSNNAQLLLFGDGPGSIISSSLTNPSGEGDEGIMYNKYGFGYGARMGFIWLMIQIGVIGLILFLLMFIYIFRKTYQIFKSSNDKKHKIIIIGSMSIIYILLLDLFTYSSTIFQNGAAALFTVYLISQAFHSPMLRIISARKIKDYNK